jgi:hypothetical protein
MSRRRVLGLVLVFASAVTAVWSAFVAWYGGRNGTDIRLGDLFDGLTPAASNTIGSLLIPLALSAVLALAGIAVRWRRLWALGGLIAVATAVSWVVRQAQTVTGLHSGAVGGGPWMALGAGAGMCCAAAVATAAPRRRRSRYREPEQLPPGWTPTPESEVGRTEGGSEPRRVDQQNRIDELDRIEELDRIDERDWVAERDLVDERDPVEP